MNNKRDKKWINEKLKITCSHMDLDHDSSFVLICPTYRYHTVFLQAIVSRQLPTSDSLNGWRKKTVWLFLLYMKKSRNLNRKMKETDRLIVNRKGRIVLQ